MPFALTPEDYVERLYRTVLRRKSDPAGAAYWAQVMRDSGDPTRVLRDMMSSEEYAMIVRPSRRDRSQSKTGGAASVRFGDVPRLACSQTAAGLPVGLDIIVPVFNAAEWLHICCDAYRAFDIRPLYIVDAASSDDSLAILQRRGERAFTLANERQFVEPLLSTVIPYLGSEWVLRLDDDELPTRATLDWIARHLDALGKAIVGLPRRWVRATDGRVESCLVADGSWKNDVQHRLFRPAEVRPTSEIHTPGIHLDATIEAPPDAGILHLDWLVRDRAARHRKLLAYEAYAENKGWPFKAQYLPEDMPENFYEGLPVTDEIALSACRRLVESLGGRSPISP